MSTCVRALIAGLSLALLTPVPATAAQAGPTTESAAHVAAPAAQPITPNRICDLIPWFNSCKKVR